MKGYHDLRIKCAVDDGTGVMRAVMDRDCTEKLLNKTLDNYLNLGEKMENTIIEDIVKTILLKPYELCGYAIIDDYGITFVCDDVEPIKFDREKVEELLGDKI